MIPKIIHYCWFGDKKIPPLDLSLIKEWKELQSTYDVQKKEFSDLNKNNALQEGEIEKLNGSINVITQKNNFILSENNKITDSNNNLLMENKLHKMKIESYKNTYENRSIFGIIKTKYFK